MRKFIIIFTVLAALVAIPVAQASKTPTQRSLQAQVNALKSRVDSQARALSALQQRVGEAEQAIGYVGAYAVCVDTAILWEAIRGTWIGLGWGDVGSIDDEGACAAIGFDRNAQSARSTQSAPSLPTFSVPERISGLW